MKASTNVGPLMKTITYVRLLMKANTCVGPLMKAITNVH